MEYIDEFVIEVGGYTVTVEQSFQNVVTEGSTPDPHWQHIDSHGHEHHYRRGYPTLTLVVDEEHWCDGREGLYSHDPHMHTDAFHYECALCGEVIKPGLRPPGLFTQYKDGQPRISLSGGAGAGITAAMRLTEEEYDSLAGFAQAQTQAEGDESWRGIFADRAEKLLRDNRERWTHFTFQSKGLTSR